jgi:hypothetical protein
MHSFWMVVVVVAACDSGAPTCKDAVTKARSADESMTFDAAAKLVGKCELEDWSVETRKCIASATTRNQLHLCTAKLSPDEHARALEAMAAMTRFKNEMCQCSTSECVQKVSDEMTKWGMDQSRDQAEPPPMSEDEMKSFTALGDEMGRCMQRTLSPDQAIDKDKATPEPPF